VEALLTRPVEVASAASSRDRTSAGKCGQINDGRSIPPQRFRKALIGTYKLLILDHYLPRRFFPNDLLQACTSSPYIVAENRFGLSGFAAEQAIAKVLGGQDAERRRAADPLVI
jgi:hypothetical protein